MRQSGNARRGLTKAELIVVISVILIILILVVLLRVAESIRFNQRTLTVMDATQLSQIHKAMIVMSRSYNGRLPTPSMIHGAATGLPQSEYLREHDTTAFIYAAMIAQDYITPPILLGPTEANPNISVKADYNYDAYDPVNGVLWDATFTADLQTGSNTSYAHMPLFGERFEKHWTDTVDGSRAILGNRGPLDGKHDPDSYTYRLHGGSREWVGNICFADNSVRSSDSFVIPGITWNDLTGAQQPDNIFAMEDGKSGVDNILTFTRSIRSDEFELQHD